MQHYGIPATSRASFGIYNTRDDIDALVAALGSVKNLFK
jgi:cysteine desulfurase/selenocysteine lyase